MNSNPHQEHRSRVQKRVSEMGFAGMEEHEVLEYLLFFVIPRRDTNPIAHALIDRFGSFCGVLDAGEEELQTVPGIGPAAARYLHALQLVDNFYATHRKQKKLPLNIPANAKSYVAPLFKGLANERMYLIAMDDQSFPMRNILLAEGQPGAVLTHMQKLAREAVNSGCTSAILAHNHPRGIAVPSAEDLQATRNICKTLGLLGITLLDHIIVADDDSMSLREMGRMYFYDPIRGDVDRF